MSYITAQTGNQMSDFFSMLVDFDLCAANLLKCDGFPSFRIWFEKCMKVDKRCTFLFLRKHMHQLEPEWVKYAQKWFNSPFGVKRVNFDHMVEPAVVNNVTHWKQNVGNRRLKINAKRND